MQEKTGKILTWILLSAAALGQLLIVAGFTRENMDLMKYGKTIPISYIDIRFHANTADTLGWAVIVLVAAACLVCVARKASVTLAAVLGSIVLFSTFLSAYYTTAEYKIWDWGAGFVLVCLLASLARQNAFFGWRQPAPDRPPARSLDTV